MYAGKRCNSRSNLTKRYKLDRVASVDNKPPPDKNFGPKQMCGVNNPLATSHTFEQLLYMFPQLGSAQTIL